MTEPEISVVMGVRDGQAQLPATMQSILSQAGVDLEFIIVDDGSADETATQLDSYARSDARIRVLRQPRLGLTDALIEGCAQARGTFIARQDCGDRSLDLRLSRQAALLRARPDIALCAVGASFMGPQGEKLYEIAQTTDALRRGLSGRTLQTIVGPSHHGATMFRRSSYAAVGGYRSAFRVSQDLDLWLRLCELGACVATPDVLYEATLASGALSQTRRAEQLETARVILHCAALRRKGEDDAVALRSWTAACEPRKAPTKPNEAAFYYFLAGILRGRDRKQARDYYLRSLHACFWQPKVWARLLTLSVGR